MANSVNRFLEDMMDFFSRPIHRKRALSSVEKILLTEEFGAEKSINIITVAIYFLLFLLSLFLHFTGRGFGFKTTVLPFLVVSLLTSMVLIKVYVLGGNKKLLYKVYFSQFKYMIIFYHIIIISVILMVNFRNVEFREFFFSFAGPWGLTLLYMVVASALMIINIFRYSIASSIYTAVLLVFSNFVISGVTPEGVSLRVALNALGVEHLVFIVALAVLVVFTAFITVRVKRMLYRSIEQEKLERFLPEIVVNELVRGDKELSLKGQHKRVTILFSDIRGFTTMSEQLEPQEVISFLNEYLRFMIDTIFKYKGTLDKIMGDGIMAIYGSPFLTVEDEREEVRDGALNAVLSAIEMNEKLKVFNMARVARGKEPIRIGVGIHTGYVTLGNIGTEKRMEFTAIGDTVNTASRIESLTKKVNSSILISKATKDELDSSILTEKKGRFLLKGKTKAIELYNVDSAGGDERAI